jgi:excisionase family DNA binding protein
MEKRFISPLELSQYLDLKPDTIYSWVWQKRIPYCKIGRLVKFDLREIEEWLKDKRIKEMN